MIARPNIYRGWVDVPAGWHHPQNVALLYSWCVCCGRMGYTGVGGSLVIVEGWDGGNALVPQGRCVKHLERNPCAIEGCARTTSAGKVGYALDQWLCSAHWKSLVPPRSPERLAYHRFWRIAKRRGWDEALSRRFWRYWQGLVVRARRRHGGGHLDIAAIDRFLAQL